VTYNSRPCPEPAAMVDLSGLGCPGTLLGARHILDALREGQVLLLLSDCAGTRDDLVAWARQTGNELIACEPRERGVTGYRLRRGRSQAMDVSARLDLRGSLEPAPIVEANQRLKGMRAGEVLELVSDCRGIQDDLAGWARVTGNEIVAMAEAEAGAREFYLRKRSPGAAAASP